MNTQYRKTLASHNEIDSFCLIGEAVCLVQILEDLISVLIILKRDVKKPGGISKKEADKLRENYRLYTLGRAIRLIKKESILPKPLQESLENLLLERNWLIHKSIQNEREALSESNKLKIKLISEKARALLQSIEAELMEYSSFVGVNMSEVQAEIQKDIEKI